MKVLLYRFFSYHIIISLLWALEVATYILQKMSLLTIAEVNNSDTANRSARITLVHMVWQQRLSLCSPSLQYYLTAGTL